MAVENLELTRIDTCINLNRKGEIWVYENDGRYGESSDPGLAVVGAEGLSRGRVIFDAWKNSQIEEMEGGE